MYKINKAGKKEKIDPMIAKRSSTPPGAQNLDQSGQQKDTPVGWETATSSPGTCAGQQVVLSVTRKTWKENGRASVQVTEQGSSR